MVKAPDFDSGIRRFESFLLSQISFGQVSKACPIFIVADKCNAHARSPRNVEMAYNSLMVFTGNANPKLAPTSHNQLNVDLGRANVGRFSMVKSPSSCRNMSAVATSSCCNRPAPRPTTT